MMEMRKKERAITKEEIDLILERELYGILSTTDVDGYPYGVPLSYTYINGAIYFHGVAAVGKKNIALDKSSKVCFTVVGNVETLPEKFSTKYESVMVFGEVKKLSDDEKIVALKEILSKYSSAFMESGMKYVANSADKADVYKLTIEHVSGKARR